jgi:hypothetical protein
VGKFHVEVEVETVDFDCMGGFGLLEWIEKLECLMR